jgi:hypothetical protein
MAAIKESKEPAGERISTFLWVIVTSIAFYLKIPAKLTIKGIFVLNYFSHAQTH